VSVVTVRPRAAELLRVVELDPLTDPRWEALVEDHPDRVIYHHPRWLRTLQSEYKRPLLGLGCEDADGQLRGILPLMQTRGLPLRTDDQLTGRRLSSLPRTPVAGPLARDSMATATLVREAIARTAVDSGVHLQLKMPAGLLDEIEGMARIAWRSTYVLELNQLPSIDGRARRRNTWAVNKAKRSGVQVRPAETEADLRAWYRLYLGTMRGLAVPPRPYRFFRAAWQLLRPVGMMRLLLAEQRTDGPARMLAGSVFLMYGSTVFYAFTGWQRADHSLRANDLIHWHAIQDAGREGFQWYDFGEVAGGQDSLAAFKSKWGAEPRQL
jgi:hypothetical protein